MTESSVKKYEEKEVQALWKGVRDRRVAEQQALLQEEARALGSIEHLKGKLGEIRTALARTEGALSVGDYFMAQLQTLSPVPAATQGPGEGGE